MSFDSAALGGFLERVREKVADGVPGRLALLDVAASDATETMESGKYVESSLSRSNPAMMKQAKKTAKFSGLSRNGLRGVIYRLEAFLERLGNVAGHLEATAGVWE